METESRSYKNGKDKLIEPPQRFEPGWLAKMDSRFGLTREMRERFASFTSDLGGRDQLSYAQRSLCERALWIEYAIAQIEAKLSKGEPVDTGPWVQSVNALLGLYRTLGLRRRARDIPTLAQYLAERDAEAEQAESEPDAAIDLDSEPIATLETVQDQAESAAPVDGSQ